MIDPWNRRTSAQLDEPGAAAADAGFAARARLARLRTALVRATKSLRPRWGEPPVFFFDPKRQAELEALRPPDRDPLAGLGALIDAELAVLFATVEARRVARATDGLTAAARALAPHCRAARDLAELLAVPDDEVFLVLAPAERSGVRLHLRGAAGVAQLSRLLAEEPHPPAPSPRGRGGEKPSRAVNRDGSSVSDSPSPPGGGGRGVGFLAPVQLFAPAALRPDGTLPGGFAGCAHWLWPTQPLSAVPRINGERVVLVGPAVVGPAPDVEPRFPELAVECELVQRLGPSQTAEALARLCGAAVPVPAPAGHSVARAA